MRPSRLLACAAAVAVLSACAGSSSSSTPTPSSAGPCSSDSVSPTHSLITVQPPSPAQTISTHQALACGTTVRVAQSGATDLYFSGMQLRCQLTQHHLPAGHIATLISRRPSNAYFFRLTAGDVVCSNTQAANGTAICGTSLAQIGRGTVQTIGPAQWTATCDWEPVFEVAVREGSVRVVDPAGHEVRLFSGYQLTFNFTSRLPTVTPVVFSADDRAVFIAQARVMVLPQLPQTITFTSKQPPSPVPGDTYLVTVAASSGNPVSLSIDTASTSVCSISIITNIVTFNTPGLCIIDASQPGDAEYQAAPPAQLRVKVG